MLAAATKRFFGLDLKLPLAEIGLRYLYYGFSGLLS